MIRNEREKIMIDVIQRTIDEQGDLPFPAKSLAPEADLYRAGLTPFAAVQVMLALEKALKIEFPEHMLNRRSMASIDAISACIGDVQDAAPLRKAA